MVNKINPFQEAKITNNLFKLPLAAVPQDQLVFWPSFSVDLRLTWRWVIAKPSLRWEVPPLAVNTNHPVMTPNAKLVMILCFASMGNVEERVTSLVGDRCLKFACLTLAPTKAWPVGLENPSMMNPFSSRNSLVLKTPTAWEMRKKLEVWNFPMTYRSTWPVPPMCPKAPTIQNGSCRFRMQWHLARVTILVCIWSAANVTIHTLALTPLVANCRIMTAEWLCHKNVVQFLAPIRMSMK